MSRIQKGMVVTLQDGTTATVVKFSIANQIVTCEMQGAGSKDTWTCEYMAERFRDMIANEKAKQETTVTEPVEQVQEVAATEPVEESQEVEFIVEKFQELPVREEAPEVIIIEEGQEVAVTEKVQEPTVAGYPKEFRMRNEEKVAAIDETETDVTIEFASGQTYVVSKEEYLALWEGRHFRELAN